MRSTIAAIDPLPDVPPVAYAVAMRAIRNIVILTGAGVSAESGIATFRGPGGLWEGHRVEDVCTPHALKADPARYLRVEGAGDEGEA